MNNRKHIYRPVLMAHLVLQKMIGVICALVIMDLVQLVCRRHTHSPAKKQGMC